MTLKFVSIFDFGSENNFYKKSVLESLKVFSQYYGEYYSDQYKDLSFAIFQDDKSVGYVECAVFEGVLKTPDGGINIHICECEDKEQKKIYKHVLDYLYFLSNQQACSSMILKDSLSGGRLSILGELLFNERFQSRLTFEIYQDFTGFSEKSFYASLRKSYKSLVNWGKRELKTSCFNKENFDQKKFNEFQEFHYKISGKITRSQKTWDTQCQMIDKGMGELILSTYEDKLVAGSFYADFGEKSIYFSGVYERDLFDFGISHFLLYQGIMRSYERQKTLGFSLGYFDTDIGDSKFYKIQFFKKGFCKELKPVIFWTKKVHNE